MRIKLLILIFFLLIHTGCTDIRILEDIGFIHGMALDIKVKEEYDYRRNLLITVSIPQIEQAAKKNREVLTTVGRSDKEAMLSFARQSNRQLVSGQLKNILYGLELAESGIGENIDTLNRDPTFGSRIKISVVNGSANELLSRDYPEHPRTSQYIDEMLEKEAQLNVIPETRLYHFTKDLFDDGRDPVAPVLKMGKNEIIVDGIGLFQDDRYITKLEPGDSRVFFFLRGDFTEGALHFDIEDEEKNKPAQLLYDSLENHRRISVDTSKFPDLEVNIELNIRGSLLEYNGTLDITNKTELHHLEQIIEGKIKAHAEEIVKVMQEEKVDSIGIGKVVRKHLDYETWSSIDWRDIYSNAMITIEVHAVIKDIGYFS
ncbi:Ger(x)C family spore germination protein [Alkalihalobacterium sp. APHAB7]|uniref:Ger(x)C family spore germination protein n=1 Tax=Alkalihalobacterium sp. APHAB7 TaxID=3402081 RepID=UPI003AAFC069